MFLNLIKRLLGLLLLPNATNTPITIANEADFFKFKYEKRAYATIFKDNPYLMAIKKEKGFVGKKSIHKVETDFGGSTGFSTLPTATPVSVDEVELTHKKLYARLYLEGLAWEASKGDEGAMEDASAFETKRKIQSFKRTLEEHLLGDGDGSMGTINAATPGGTAAAPTIVISAATWVKAKWQTGQIVNVGSATDNYKVTAVAPSSRTISLSREDGSADLTSLTNSTAVIYLQGSKDAAFTGARQVLSATSGSLYGISVGNGWQAYQKDASSATISPSMLQEIVLGIYDQVEETPNLIIASITQYRKLLSYQDHLKQLTVPIRLPMSRTEGEVKESEKYLSPLSFTSVALATDRGLIPVVANRFLKASECMLVNTDYIKFCMTPAGMHFKDQDGTVFLRSSTTDEYEGRYAVYGDQLIIPAYQGYLYGLST